MVTLKDVKHLEQFDRGKRGLLFVGLLGKKKVVVKRERADSPAVGSIANEIRFLKVLNAKRIGPQVLFSSKKYFGYYYVAGRFFPDFLERCKSKSKILLVINRVFNQCYVMDGLGIKKEEMHHPHKHILVDRYRVVMLDFERCRYTEDPSNVTQFSSYLLSSFISELLSEKGIRFSRNKVIECAKAYKGDFSRNAFKKLVSCFR
tara:strand:+ start:720 stop:1331 length:612 start_codon:yes stop_codon:yes gene_type:complete